MFESLYYPTYDPPVTLFRANLLFSDRLHIIVPDGVDPELHPANQAVVERAAGVLNIQRRFPWSFMDWSNYLGPLDVAFGELAQRRENVPQPKLERTSSGHWHCPGHVFLHRYKTNLQIRDLLTKHRLILPAAAPIAGYDIVEMRASSLILALLADNISAEQGLHTVTDVPVEHLVAVLCAPKQNTAVDALAASIIRVEIPERLTDLTAEQFLELRERYASIREPFQAAVLELFNYHRIAEARTAKGVQELVESATQKYSGEVARLRASQPMQRVKRWVPFGLTTVGGFAGAVSGLLDPKVGAALAFGGATISFGLELLAMRPASYVPARAESQRLLANLQSDIFRTPVYKRLLEPT